MQPRRKRPTQTNGTDPSGAALEGLGEKPQENAEQLVYELDTPIWRKYYQQIRKTIRFPRYYKKELNW
jgi:hypothetical protein